MVQRPSTTPVFILAGGAGERLTPLTEVKPKPAVSFGGTHQILDFTLSNCINSGLKKIFVLTQYQREPLHDYVRQNHLRLSQSSEWRPGDNLLPVPPVSGKRYRGTADAVFQNLPLIRFDSAEHVLIASGDHIYSMDYRTLLARHSVSGADLTIAAVRRPVEEAGAFGVLDVDHGMATRFKEKPSRESLPESGDVLVSMGIYVFRRQALLDIADRAAPTETDFGNDIVPKLISARKVAVYDFGTSPRNYWRDVGSLDSYFQANMDLLGPCPQFHPEMDAHWPVYGLADTSVVKTGDSRISKRATIAASTIRRSVISQGVCIDPGATIEDCVILPGARIGKNARLQNAIVAERALIPEGVTVGVNATLDRSRFAVTPAGVVVVSGLLRAPSEQGRHAGATHQTVSAA